MNFNKRVNGSWVDTPHYIHKTDTDILTTLPDVVYVNDTTATVGLKGNMEQASGVSPTTPIQPSECGERTGNLFDISAYSSYTTGISNIVTTSNSITYTATSALLAIKYFFPLNTTDIFTIQLGSESSKVRLELRYRKNGSTVRDTIVVTIGNSYVIRGSEYVDEIQINISNGTSTGTCTASNIMLNAGSTPLPYEPWGIKIPISSANTTTPVYLGEVESTRRIKKYEFTGTESISSNTLGVSRVGFTIAISNMLSNGRKNGYCTHFVAQNSPSGSSLDGITYGASDKVLYVTFSAATATAYNLTDVTSIKTWLAQQYAAGTPVTVWYVLATPTTGIVNEPLMKIGNYTDEVSGITIPVTAGGDTLSVDTTVQPSEVTVNYKGWHPVADVHERDNGAWT